VHPSPAPPPPPPPAPAPTPCRSNVHKRRDIGELMAYLDRVAEAMAAFEARLWGHVRNYRRAPPTPPRLGPTFGLRAGRGWVLGANWCPSWADSVHGLPWRLATFFFALQMRCPSPPAPWTPHHAAPLPRAGCHPAGSWRAPTPACWWTWRAWWRYASSWTTTAAAPRPASVRGPRSCVSCWLTCVCMCICGVYVEVSG
jgi:hypothetical protein